MISILSYVFIPHNEMSFSNYCSPVALVCTNQKLVVFVDMGRGVESTVFFLPWSSFL